MTFREGRALDPNDAAGGLPAVRAASALSRPVDDTGDSWANLAASTPIVFDPSALVGSNELGLDLDSDDVVGSDGITTFFPAPESFDFLVGSNAAGTWQLVALDGAGGDTGTVARVTIVGTVE